MIAESTPHFDALETLGRSLTQTFCAAGAELVAPAVIQPAGLFLDVIGEQLRGRTYVFTDPDGLELCLRPDLTVPTCRLYLERDRSARSARRFCYSGPVFRYQPENAPSTNAREARQAGFEMFGFAESASADAEVLAVIVSAVRATGLSDFELHIGDLGLLHAILDALPMPARWRRRLAHQFWRADAFHAELERLVEWPAASARGIDPDLLARLDPDQPNGAEAIVAEHLATAGIDVFGTRRIGDITAGLLEAAADARAGPLSRAHAALIDAYVAISDTPARAIATLETLAAAAHCDIGGAIATYRQRLDFVMAAGVALDRARFSGEFGRRFEYYTGFVFDLVAPSLGGLSPVAGGGRYDGLLRAVGAPHDVPAVGAAVHTERLRAALAGGRP